MMGVETLCLIPFTMKYKQLNKAGKYMYGYLVISLIFATGSLYMAQRGINNMWFVTPMYCLQFIILSFFYYNVLNSQRIKLLIKYVAVVVIAFYIFDFLKLEGFLLFNSISTTISTFILIIYGLLFFLQLLKDTDLIQNAIYINSLPSFWFNAGLFIFLCCSILHNLSYNFIQTNVIVDYALISIVYISGILQVILFYIGVLKVKRVVP
jgi:hypothetical protein